MTTGYLSSGKQLLLLVLVVVGLCTATQATSAATLPSTISSGSYSESDATVPPSGTTLNVQDMLNDAAANNLTEAVFNLDRAAFEGTLTINLPTTVSSWATNNIPLRIMIHNGQSSIATWPSTYIQVTGLLALGSNITIQGGLYHYTNQFVNLPNGITIQDGSFFGIEGGSYRAHYPTAGGTHTTSLVSCSDGYRLALSSGATFSVSHNTMIVAAVNVGSGDWWLQTLYINRAYLTISGGSSLSISNNDIKATDVKVAGVWYWATLYNHGGSITLSTNSTLSISNSKVDVSDVTVGSWWCFTMYALNAAITASYGSTVAINQNVMSAENTKVTSYLYMYEFHALNTPVTFHSSSYLTLSGTHTTLVNAKVYRVTWLVYLVEGSTSSTTIHTNSAIIISNNTAVASMMTVEYHIFRLLIYVKDSPLTVTSSGAITITNNTVSVSDVQTNHLWMYVLHPSGNPPSVTDNSTIKIADMYMSAVNVQAHRSCWLTAFSTFSASPSTPTAIRRFSTLSVSNVHMNVVDMNVGHDGFHWIAINAKSTPTAISDSSVVSIANNSLTATNVNTVGGTHWHAVYGTDSSITITAGSSLAVGKNTLVKATTASILGPLTEKLVWMSGTQSWLGVTTAGSSPSCGAVSECGGVQSGRFSCDVGKDNVNFDCTSTSSPYPTQATTSPPSNNGYSGSDDDNGTVEEADVVFFVGIAIGSAVGFALLVFALVFACIYCFRRGGRFDPTPTSGTEMAPTTTNTIYEQQHQEHTNIYPPTLAAAAQSQSNVHSVAQNESWRVAHAEPSVTTNVVVGVPLNGVTTTPTYTPVQQYTNHYEQNPYGCGGGYQ